MQYRTLGRNGVRVSSLALGAMNFGAIGRTTQDDVTAIVGAALEAGINVVDTADVYPGSEEMVGKAVRAAGRRDDVLLATKAGLPTGSDHTEDRNHRGSFRRWFDHRAGRQPAPPRRRPRRPLPDPPVGP